MSEASLPFVPPYCYQLLEHGDGDLQPLAFLASTFE